MADALDRNDADVRAILDAYDELMRRAERYLRSLDEQHAVATAAGTAQLGRHIDAGRRHTRALIEALETDVLDKLIDLRNNQHHVRLAREGKLV